MAREKGGGALEALVEISDIAQGDPAASALAELAGLFAGTGDEKEASRYEAILLDRYPTSRFAAAALWEKGWSAWKKGDIRAADGAWTRALDAGNDPRQESRLLFWAARANEKLGDSRTSSGLLERLRKGYPTDYYTYLAFPSEPPRIRDLPAQRAAGEGEELAEWGFVIYARMVLSLSSDAATRAASAKLALWLGDARGAFLDSIPFASMLGRTDPLPRALLEAVSYTHLDVYKRQPEGIPLPGDDVRVLPVHHEVEKGVKGAVVPGSPAGEGLPEGRQTVPQDGGEASLGFAPDAGDTVLQEYSLSSRQGSGGRRLGQRKEFPFAAAPGRRSSGGGHLRRLKTLAEQKATPGPVKKKGKGEDQALMGIHAGGGPVHGSVHLEPRPPQAGEGLPGGDPCQAP